MCVCGGGGGGRGGGEYMLVTYLRCSWGSRGSSDFPVSSTHQTEGSPNFLPGNPFRVSKNSFIYTQVPLALEFQMIDHFTLI